MTERVSLFEALAERRFLTILGLMAAAVGLYALYWNHEADAVKAWWDLMVADARTKGLTVAATHVETQGFPYRTELAVENLIVTAQSALGAVIWQTDHLTIHARPYGPMHLVIDSPDPQNLLVAGAHFALTSQDARASLVEDANGTRRLSVDLKAPVIGDEAGALGQAKRFQYHLQEDAAGGTKQAALQIDEGRLARPPLGPLDVAAEADLKRAETMGYDGTATLSIASDAAAVNILLGLLGFDRTMVAEHPGGRMTLSFRIRESRLFSGDRLILDLGGLTKAAP